MATRDTGGQQKATRTREESDEVEASVDTEVAERRKEMTEDVDSILDEIDEVLESKRCPSCGETKSATEFGSNQSLSDGFRFTACRAIAPRATRTTESEEQPQVRRCGTCPGFRTAFGGAP